MTPHSSPRVLVIQFCKWPVAGEVKTRLIPALGAQGALEAHVTLSCAVLRNLLDAGYPVELWWDRESDRPPGTSSMVLIDSLERTEVIQRVQNNGDLGERMLGALAEGLERAERVVIVGSDCPAVEGGYVRAAVEALGTSDVVLGPAEDGGYVLIGARRVEGGMFEGVSWGTEKALGQTLKRSEAVGLAAAQLSTLWDVDEVGDWERFMRG